MHPHSMADIFESINPGEARVSYEYPPIPDRTQDWQASFYDGEPCIGHGRTREDAAIMALEHLYDTEYWPLSVEHSLRQARVGNYDAAGILHCADAMIYSLYDELEARDRAIQNLQGAIEQANERANIAEGKIYELEETIDGQH